MFVFNNKVIRVSVDVNKIVVRIFSMDMKILSERSFQYWETATHYIINTTNATFFYEFNHTPYLKYKLEMRLGMRLSPIYNYRYIRDLEYGEEMELKDQTYIRYVLVDDESIITSTAPLLPIRWNIMKMEIVKRLVI